MLAFFAFFLNFRMKNINEVKYFSVKCLTEIFHKVCIFWKDAFNIGHTFEIKVEQKQSSSSAVFVINCLLFPSILRIPVTRFSFLSPW